MFYSKLAEGKISFMEITNLNLFYFLVYTEITFVILSVLKLLLTFFMSIILSIFKLPDYKQDIFIIYTEIPLMLILLVVSTHLAYINTINETIFTKVIFFTCLFLVVLIFRLLYQKDIYGLAKKEDNVVNRQHKVD